MREIDINSIDALQAEEIVREVGFSLEVNEDGTLEMKDLTCDGSTYNGTYENVQEILTILSEDGILADANIALVS